ncbi:MAG: hypothetical protein E7328_06845 [Clostridiales bacterium]|nr:hypothetical protein [Clostridiales bacterium]
MEKCLLDANKICTMCGECDMCEYEHKLCDNCFSCLDFTADYNEILIDQILLNEENKKEG